MATERGATCTPHPPRTRGQSHAAHLSHEPPSLSAFAHESLTTRRKHTLSTARERRPNFNYVQIRNDEDSMWFRKPTRLC